jgi:TatD DNase family protein
MLLVDSHCHLDFPDFDEDRHAILERARQAGVGLLLTISTHASRFDRLRALCERYPEVYCTLGIHPHQAEEEFVHCDVAALVALAKATPKTVGIGETGLDYYYDKSPRAVQQESFRRHIRIGLETGLPLIVHTRDADDDTLRILKEEGGGQGLTGLFHCFSGGPHLAEQALALGFYLSFSGILTFKKSALLREVAAWTPMDRLLVETDAPFLAPMPMRGKRNEPAFVAHTAACLAELKGVAPETMAEHSTANFMRLFSRVPRTAMALAA